MTVPGLTINVARLMRELHHLASVTDCPAISDASLPLPQQAVTRIVFTQRDLEARAWIKDLARQADFLVREDAVGNTFLRWTGTQPDLPAVATGSHIDAIPFSGMYDGTVGVLGGLEAMRALREAGFTPRRSIELLLFTSEEPTRFGIGCLGSRLLNGSLSPAAAEALPDRLHETQTAAAQGGTLASVRGAAGFTGPLSDVPVNRPVYAAWLELHIEQGPLLEREGIDLSIITHIAGPASYRYTVRGLGGHAGALLMPDRRDALCAAAELVLAIEQHVLQANGQAGTEHNSVGTVGKLDVFPGAVNAVPSLVTFMLDIRDTHVETREAIMTRIREATEVISKRRGVAITEELINADLPATCDPGLVQLLHDAASQAGASVRPMVSRAYHDTSFMALTTPVAMLFVPSRGGVSHRPDEYTSPASIALGTRVLAVALATLSGSEQALPRPLQEG